jgi:processive 1,2-diacylglycerol beta-glucosyltransferase
MARILILTASIGEGHNTAARNIREALLAETGGIDSPCEVLVADPYTRTNPTVNKLVQKGYATAINRYPRAWKVVFELLSRRGVLEGMGPLLTELTTAVRELIAEFKPDVIASTYPVFAYLNTKIHKKKAGVPFFNVITDSTIINSVWYRWPTSGSLVADEATADALRAGGVPPDLIHILGFPVTMKFETLVPAAAPQDGQWKALFFPGGTAQNAVGTLEQLAKVPHLEITAVTGRRFKVHATMENAGLPRHGSLVGWTDEMPQLMASHQLFIGKAGGATVQEAIAAQIPFLVNHVVPGQEEGNIAMIEQTGIGALVTGAPRRIHDVVIGALANDAALWKTWRANLACLQKPSASRSIARFLLDRCPR